MGYDIDLIAQRLTTTHNCWREDNVDDDDDNNGK